MRALIVENEVQRIMMNALYLYGSTSKVGRCDIYIFSLRLTFVRLDVD
jgi:hypothetical protein